MISYSLLQIWYQIDGIHLQVFDEKVGEAAADALSQALGFRVGLERLPLKATSRLHKLHGRDYELLWWIMEWLGKRGWEPFAAAVVPGHTPDTIRYWFRKAVDTAG